jgi:HSP20 family molecular chaperone IbpA
MFKKKKCKNCGEKINDSYNFCPYCRAPIRDFFEDEKDWGLLGRNDFPTHEEIKFPMGFNNLFNTLLKNLTSQKFNEFEDMEPESKRMKTKKGGIGISIYTSGNKPPKIKVRSFGNLPEFKEKENQIKKKVKELKLPVSDSKKFAGLPKKEPETNIRRFSDKIVYEINMPGVKSIKDVSIIQLENSIEIKALAKNKVYYKIIPINLPVRNYNLSKEKLTLEIEAKE